MKLCVTSDRAVFAPACMSHVMLTRRSVIKAVVIYNSYYTTTPVTRDNLWWR